MRRARVFLIGSTDRHPERVVKLVKFLEVFCALSSSVYLVAADCPEQFVARVGWFRIRKKENAGNGLVRRWNSLWTQLKICELLIRKVRDYDVVVLFGGFVVPIVVARILGKNPVLYNAGPNAKFQRQQIGRDAIEWIANVCSWRIAVPSIGCVEHLGLSRFKDKVVVGYFHVNEMFFDIGVRSYDKRRVVGYFGNLTKGNGGMFVDELVDGFDAVRGNIADAELLLVGKGVLAEELRTNPREGIEVVEWVEHKKIPELLDRIKVLVLVTKSDGVPTIILEAMARGVLVLASPIAGIKDVIVDGKTGFFLDDSSAVTIARDIEKVLEKSDIGEILSAAREFVSRHYTKQAACARWERILMR